MNLFYMAFEGVMSSKSKTADLIGTGDKLSSLEVTKFLLGTLPGFPCCCKEAEETVSISERN